MISSGRSTILDLPNELHCLISTYMTSNDLIALSQTNRQLSAIYQSLIVPNVMRSIQGLTRALAAIWTKHLTNYSGEMHPVYDTRTRWQNVVKHRFTSEQIEHLLSHFLPKASTAHLDSLIRRAGKNDFYFLAAAIRFLLQVADKTAEGRTCGPGEIPHRYLRKSHTSPATTASNISDPLPFLELLLQYASATITPEKLIDSPLSWNEECPKCLRSTFMASAIASGSLRAVEMVWEVYYHKDKARLEHDISYHIGGLISNLVVKGRALIAILEYLMDEWEISADFLIKNLNCCESEASPDSDPDWPTMLALLVRPAVLALRCWCDQNDCFGVNLHRTRIFNSKRSSRGITTRTHWDTLYHDASVPLDVMKSLIRRGADLNSNSVNNPFLQMTSETLVCSWIWPRARVPPQIGPTGALQLLLEAGGNPDIVIGYRGYTLLHAIENLWHDLPLFTLVVERSPEFINYQASFFEHPPPFENERLSPLQLFIFLISFRKLEHPETYRLLPFIQVMLANGADPYLRDGPGGKSAVMIAASDQPRMGLILQTLVGSEHLTIRWKYNQSWWREQGCSLEKNEILHMISHYTNRLPGEGTIYDFSDSDY
ncbi:hypothetical protein BJ508DRAFT_349400 [Ascobolus immersus RN42]|uniref:F-box domain-containing protein n=1 Tax=Ascobolus immersus RN42 TaxID=1160509 RepID=A0A3N4I2N9_ASCIM|nr:hypothetical protein BJ508DRAFT_349400 [Ascobolus immersus RN42]